MRGVSKWGGPKTRKIGRGILVRAFIILPGFQRQWYVLSMGGGGLWSRENWNFGLGRRVER